MDGEKILERVARGEFKVGDHVMVSSGRVYLIKRLLDPAVYRGDQYDAVQIQNYGMPQAREYGPHRHFKAKAFTLHKPAEQT